MQEASGQCSNLNLLRNLLSLPNQNLRQGAELDLPTVSQAADNESTKRADNKNRRVCFGDDRAWETQEQPEYETDHPAGPRRQLHERNHQTDAKAIKKCAE